MLAGRMLAMVTNLVVQVTAVRYLGKTDYGIFAYALAIASLAASASILGQDRALGRFLALYDENGDHGRGQGAIAVAMGTVFLLGSAIAATVIGLHALGIDVTSDERAVTTLLILIALAPLTALDTLFISLFAVVASPKAIFWRRHVVTPLLRLASVLFVVATAGSVEHLAIAYLISGLIGVGLYVALAIRVLRRHQLGQRHVREFPAGDLWRFGAPMVVSDVALALRATLVVIFLQALRNVEEVSAFRAVVPIAQLNVVAMQSFRLLYLPAAARLFARDDKKGVASLYWQSAAWLAVGTFPLFVATFSFAEPLTLLLFGEEYRSSARVLAVLSLGYYVSAALGLNALTLKASGRVALVVAVDTGTAIVGVALNLVLISEYGALGAAFATSGILILQNVLVHFGLRRILDGLPVPVDHRLAYVWIAGAAGALLAVQTLLEPPVTLTILLGTIATVAVLMRNRRMLQIGDTFPEVARLPVIGKYLVAAP